MGSLTIGEPHYDEKDEYFSCPFFYRAPQRIGDDEFKSAKLEAVKQFLALLQKNGFWHRHGNVDITQTLTTESAMTFMIGVHARAKPAVIV